LRREGQEEFHMFLPSFSLTYRYEIAFFLLVLMAKEKDARKTTP
jgi:hypothetical protein